MLKVLAAQVSVPSITTVEARDAQTARVAGMIDAALEEAPADLVFLPELFALDYAPSCFDRLEDLDEEPEGPTFTILSELARRFGVHLVYGYARRAGEGRHISHAAIDPSGRLIGCYDKLHVTSYEKDYFVPGSGLFVFEVAGLKVAPIICYDIRYPEPWRRLAMEEGVDLILHPVAFERDNTFYSWRPFVVTRALENQVYVLSLNRAGENNGGTIFCPPWVDETKPEVVLGHEEGCYRFDVDPDVLESVRSGYNLRSDLRDDYGTMAVDGPRQEAAVAAVGGS